MYVHGEWKYIYIYIYIYINLKKLSKYYRFGNIYIWKGNKEGKKRKGKGKMRNRMRC